MYDDDCRLCRTCFGAGPSYPIQTPSQRFERTVFFVRLILNNLLVALSKRQVAYKKLNRVLGFLRRLSQSTREEIVKSSGNLVKTYPEGLELNLSEELFEFTELLKFRFFSNMNETDVAVELQYYRLLSQNSLDVCFPNLNI